MVKSKQLKLLRKKFEKANKSSLDVWLAEKDATSTSTCINTSSSTNTINTINNDHKDLSFHSWNALQLASEPGRLQECMDLFLTNMGDQYRASSWGLNCDDKQAEWSHAHARFLVVLSTTNNNMAGFCHYRFDYDDEDDPSEVVLYVYELQIQPNVQRRGLGRTIMSMLEQLARSMELSKIMLTVFKSNQGAMHFYRNVLHYDMDDSSPSNHGQVVDYEILCKRIEYQ